MGLLEESGHWVGLSARPHRRIIQQSLSFIHQSCCSLVLFVWRSVHRQQKHYIDVPHSECACEEGGSAVDQKGILRLVRMQLGFTELKFVDISLPMADSHTCFMKYAQIVKAEQISVNIMRNLNRYMTASTFKRLFSEVLYKWASLLLRIVIQTLPIL